jgi:ATP-dependent exoDNAse (exonuclease V) beta subunit
VPAAARVAAHAMVGRFLGSATGAAFRDALARGRDVRREVAFHARIRFPDGAEVGGFDSLLVKGSIDLWLPDGEGRVRILDHKTNAPRPGARDAAVLVAHYAPQLRLYALAAERVLGAEVAGASLLLLDPAWQESGVPVEAPVDVSGPALEETRRLVHAYARALHDLRF